MESTNWTYIAKNDIWKTDKGGYRYTFPQSITSKETFTDNLGRIHWIKEIPTNHILVSNSSAIKGRDEYTHEDDRDLQKDGYSSIPKELINQQSERKQLSEGTTLYLIQPEQTINDEIEIYYLLTKDEAEEIELNKWDDSIDNIRRLFSDGLIDARDVSILAGEDRISYERAKEIGLDDTEIFLNWMNGEKIDLDLHNLEEVTIAFKGEREGDPFAPANKHVERLRTTEQSQFVLPIVGLHALETIWEQGVKENSGHFIGIFKQELVDVLQSEGYGEMFEELRETGRMEAYVYEGDIPYFVGILDDYVQIGLIGEEDDPIALLETTSEKAQKWAENLIDEYMQQAEPLE